MTDRERIEKLERFYSNDPEPMAIVATDVLRVCELARKALAAEPPPGAVEVRIAAAARVWENGEVTVRTIGSASPSEIKWTSMFGSQAPTHGPAIIAAWLPPVPQPLVVEGIVTPREGERGEQS